MSITVDWYNTDKTALIYTYQGSWTWNEFDTAVMQGNALMQSVAHTVHAVLDLHASSLVPTDIVFAKNRERITNLTPANHGKLIIYGMPSAFHLVAVTLNRLAPQWVAKRNAVFTANFDEIESAIASE